MSNDHLSADAARPDLEELGRQLYERALVRRKDERITDPSGQEIGWLLDARVPMLDSTLFDEVGTVLAERLLARNVQQVAGYGFGSYALVGAVLAASERPVRGGFVRDERKSYGRHRLVEGPLRPDEPIVLLDDILNSGRSAARALALLRTAGFEVEGLHTLFHFTWSNGRARLEEEGLWVEALLELNLHAGAGSGSDSR